MLDIRELCRTSHEIAKNAGWLDQPRSSADIVNLFVSEISEALEDFRAHKGLNEIYYEGEKPCGIPIELADVIIRVCEYVETNGLTDEVIAAHFKHEPSKRDRQDPNLASFDRFLFELTKMCVDALRTHDTPLFVVSLAAVLRWINNFSKKHGIDIDKAVKEKEAYNRTRSYRHGGKKI